MIRGAIMHQRIIEVRTSEIKKADSPNILRAIYLNPCIAIGIYNPRTRSGYMMHHPHFVYGDLEGKIREIQNDYGDLSRLRVFAAGNSIASHNDEYQRKFERSNRVYVEQILGKYFDNSQIEIRWSPDDHGSNLSLDTLTGEFDLEVYSLEGLRTRSQAPLISPNPQSGEAHPV